MFHIRHRQFLDLPGFGKAWEDVLHIKRNTLAEIAVELAAIEGKTNPQDFMTKTAQYKVTFDMPEGKLWISTGDGLSVTLDTLRDAYRRRNNPPCTKCEGKGWILNYIRNQGGICFLCDGVGRA